MDDMIIAGEKPVINNIVLQIRKEFKISNFGPISHILGIKIEKSNFTYTISQSHYIKHLLEKFNMTNTRSRNTPCTIFDKNNLNTQPFDKTKYKSAIGALIYIAKSTRPDIMFAVNKAARKSENPTVSDWNAIVNILRYLGITIDFKI